MTANRNAPHLEVEETVTHKFRLVAAFLVLLTGLASFPRSSRNEPPSLLPPSKLLSLKLTHFGRSRFPTIGSRYDRWRIRGLQDHIWIVHRTNTYEPMEIYAAAKPPLPSAAFRLRRFLSSMKKAT